MKSILLTDAGAPSADVLSFVSSLLTVSLTVLVDRVISWKMFSACRLHPPSKKSILPLTCAIQCWHYTAESWSWKALRFLLLHCCSQYRQSTSDLLVNSLLFVFLEHILPYSLYLNKICHHVTFFPSSLQTSRPLPSLCMPVSLAMARSSTHRPLIFPFHCFASTLIGSNRNCHLHDDNSQNCVFSGWLLLAHCICICKLFKYLKIATSLC